jgi:hypothetical protein
VKDKLADMERRLGESNIELALEKRKVCSSGAMMTSPRCVRHRDNRLFMCAANSNLLSLHHPLSPLSSLQLPSLLYHHSNPPSPRIPQTTGLDRLASRIAELEVSLSSSLREMAGLHTKLEGARGENDALTGLVETLKQRIRDMSSGDVSSRDFLDSFEEVNPSVNTVLIPVPVSAPPLRLTPTHLPFLSFFLSYFSKVMREEMMAMKGAFEGKLRLAKVCQLVHSVQATVHTSSSLPQ